MSEHETTRVHFHIDYSNGRSLAIPFDARGGHPKFFADEGVSTRPLRCGGFVGDMAHGASCNAEVIEFSPHSHGTHTECIGHILPEHQAVIGTIDETPTLMRLVTIGPEMRDADGFVPAEALGDLGDFSGGALALRTLPNGADKLRRDYGASPDFPVLSRGALRVLGESRLMHLLLDTPSLDHPESARLENHAAWWGLDPAVTAGVKNPAARSVTEMIFVPDDTPDGEYWLILQLAPMVSDAVPSRPMIYPVERTRLTVTQGTERRSTR